MRRDRGAPAGDTRFVDDGRGVTVVVDGHPQSHVVLDDPEDLAFEYVQHLAAILDVLPPGRLAVTHVGGAGLTLARYVAHTRPGSPQIVLEPDADLTEAVRRELPLPRGHRIRVRVQNGESGVAALADEGADALVVDAFAGGHVPAGLTTQEFLADVARALRPTGVVALNLPDEPGLRYVARVAATAAAAGLEPRALVATHDVLKGRRFGNVVLVASPAVFDVDELRRRLAQCPFPTGTITGSALRDRCRAARPLTVAAPLPSPPPPEAGAWRVR